MTQNTTPRLIVPDLARGLALLGIAAANASQAWITDELAYPDQPGWSLGGIRPDSTVDQVLAIFAALFVHVRGLPMFSTLLGFGIGLVVASLHRKGYPLSAAKRVVDRRYLWLAAFGLLHTLLMFWGDIMLIYGVIGAIVALLLAASTGTLRIIAYVSIGISAAFSVFGTVALMIFRELGDATSILQTSPTASFDSPADYFRENLAAGLDMFTMLPFSVFTLGGLVLIGVVWAREGYLVDVDRHRRVLVTWTCIAAVVALVTGIPLALAALGVIDPTLEGPLYVFNTALGPLTGPGILAGLALATNPLQKRMYRSYESTGETAAPAWTYPFVALGKRSMSGYLAQSVLFLLLAMPFTLGLGVGSTITGKTAVAVLVWLITLVLATLLEAAGAQGPFEQLHRRLAYGRTGRIEQYQPGGPRELTDPTDPTGAQKQLT